MWPSRSNNKNKNNNGSSSSPSKSISSSSSPSSPGTPNKRSMEEVWQDISLASLQDDTNTTTATPNTTKIPHNNNTNTTTSTAGLTFQDFFARPFNNKEPPPREEDISASAAFASSVPHRLPTESSNNSCFRTLAPRHVTLLSLNSGSGFQYLGNFIAPDDDNQRPSQHAFPFNNNNSPFDNAAALGPAAKDLPLKRPQERGDHSNDRRHKRMMKNRESAARSRARKQAYTTELEQEVAHLEKENAKLRRQQEQLLAASWLPKKHTLCRTSTAPF